MRYKRYGSLRLPVWSTFKMDEVVPKLEELIREGMRLAWRVSTKKDPQFDDVITRFEELEERIWRTVTPVIFLGDADAAKYPGTEQVRNTVEMLMSRYTVSLNLRRKLLRAASMVESRPGFGKRPVEDQFVIERLVVTIRESGGDLSPQQKRRLRELSLRLVDLENNYQRNIIGAIDSWTLDVTDEAEVLGIPEEVLQSARSRALSLGKEGYAFSLQHHDYKSIVDYAASRALRKRAWLAYNSRASKQGPGGPQFDNGLLMCKIAELRCAIAQILGYDNFVAQNIGSMMAEKPHVVERFLDHLAKAVKKKSKEDDCLLQRYARRKLGIRNLQHWDRAYTERCMRDELYAIDDEAIRAYFSEESILKGLSSLLARLFNCTMVEKIVSTWHESVRFFEVLNTKGKVIGGFYLDLYARPGKATDAWAVSIMTRFVRRGRIQRPVVAICANVRTPPLGEVATFSHRDICEIFHEFGHTMHLILGTTKHRESFAFYVETDVSEVPSLLLEEWGWKKDMLRLMSSHKDSGARIPEAMLSSLIASRHFMESRTYAFDVACAIFDWEIHKNPPKNEAALMHVYADAVARSTGFSNQIIACAPHTLNHIFSWGLAASYYSYLWSSSLVADIAAAFTHAGLRGELTVAQRYRRTILAPGSSRLFAESFKAFRGRGPRTRFLLRHIGIR
ncbi:MAG TPA: M3 family metallopeptidase [Candidatus Paceibacterota bacterium]|nr:M3 family metallopeptidase [Candidatus Paceibacterota bacterium]